MADERDERNGALDEDFSSALRALEGESGARALRWALRELPLDGAEALAVTLRLEELQAA